MSYIGIPPFGQTVRTVVELVATGGQTSFSINGGYLPGYIDVELNGQPLRSSDFTATDGANVVLTVAANANDEFKSTAYWPVSLVDTYRKSEAVAKVGDSMTGPLSINGATVNANSNWGSYIQPKSGSGLGAFNVTDPTGNYSLVNVDYNGKMTVKDNLVLASGKGIDFSATANGSGAMTGELLNDYEEGTWTPTLGGNATYSIQEGIYTKIGRQVTIRFDLQVSTIGTGSVRTLSGLPYSPAGANYYSAGAGYWVGVNAVNITSIILVGTNGMYFETATSSTTNSPNDNVAIWGNGVRVLMTATYFTS